MMESFQSCRGCARPKKYRGGFQGRPGVSLLIRPAAL